MTIKNLWSLNVDEVITAQKIKSELGKEYEVFFPINSQLKDIDLLLQLPRTGKSKFLTFTPPNIGLFRSSVAIYKTP